MDTLAGTDPIKWREDCSSREDLIHELIDVVSKGGNYLLNVGPTAEGVIPQPSVERLQVMGAWLDVNGEAIYGSKPGPIQKQEWCHSTAKPGTVYLHVFDWPEGGEIRVEGVEATSAYLRADADKLPLAVGNDGESLVVNGPADAPDAVATVVVLNV